jgi:hypothetical protein
MPMLAATTVTVIGGGEEGWRGERKQKNTSLTKFQITTTMNKFKQTKNRPTKHNKLAVKINGTCNCTDCLPSIVHGLVNNEN